MGGDRFTADTAILENEVAYTVRYRWRGAASWLKAGTVTIVANPNVPSPPTAFARVGGTGTQLRWLNPAEKFWKARLFRSDADSFAGASFITDVAGLAGQAGSYTGPTAAVTGYYWVVALNGSSVASPPAGPVSITA